MGRAKEAASAVVDGAAAAASAADTASSDLAESIGAKVGTLSRRRDSRLPGSVRFALAVVLSLALSSLGRSFVDHYSQNEVGSIMREEVSRSELGVLAAWRLFGLALGWYNDYDGYDLAALSLLSHGPATYLISIFYGIRALTAGAYLAVDVASAFLPFLLVRRLSGAHSDAPGTPNKDIVGDRVIQILTSLQSALVYSVVLFLAGRFLLPSKLVLYFEGVPTIKPAANATFLGLGSPMTQALSLLFGLAARTFIFTPFVTTPQTLEDQKNAEFDPVNATLGQTVAWNLWGYSTSTKVSLKRTAVAMLFTAVGTYLDTALAIKGIESYGAVVYVGVWVAAAFATGLTLRYVGSI
ncbi:hypothetical protein C8A03DRAFT_16057 [Achaetomium macrosporum]|uniref:Uncharacterized protein n=1 Tax=Achaetomium macrosporum TaxID=79813 RepID=A0AAN7C8T2_9PEZI|nr:hypothetical protein C8A03DRAFT_16057 [Achaetomium macrosporum]